MDTPSDTGDGPHDDFDEFGLLHENAAEAGLRFAAPPRVERTHVAAPSGRRVSALRWGSTPAELVLLHGGMQNAHTWDTVALALDSPLVAIDLPGHGHSDWREDRDYRPHAMADDLAAVIAELAPAARTLVGMSLGGLTALALAAEHLPARGITPSTLVLVDITPGVNRQKASEIIDFALGPETFDSFEEIVERTLLFNPLRSRSSIERGVRHNARPLPSGKWAWRYDRPDPARMGGEDAAAFDVRFTDLWDALEGVAAEIVLVQGGASPVVGDDDVAELRRRRPDAIHVVVDGAGHSVQGDRPLELAELLARQHR